MRNISILILVLLAVLGCSKDEVEDDLEATELAYYTSAQDSLRAGNYAGAIQKLQLLESRFPFGRYAEQAQLEIIYAYFKSAQPEAARSAADRFIRLHPTHPNVDYAYYLKGMVSFERDKNFLSNILPMDPSTRDPGSARESFNDFSQLIRRYPNSEYAPDAQQKMKYLRNLLAASEVHVARYYIRRGAYVAAANRGRHVFENFQESVAVPDALAVMVEAYQLLELFELADQTLLVLSTNYPGHESLDNEGNFRKSQTVKGKERGWLNIITFGLLG
jgi:outer membrane protein assembly factor BamD